MVRGILCCTAHAIMSNSFERMFCAWMISGLKSVSVVFNWEVMDLESLGDRATPREYEGSVQTVSLLFLIISNLSPRHTNITLFVFANSKARSFATSAAPVSSTYW